MTIEKPIDCLCNCCSRWNSAYEGAQTEIQRLTVGFKAGDDRESWASRAWQYLEEIVSLKKENQCLRSVLSEWDEDKSCFVQMIIADKIRDEREAKK